VPYGARATWHLFSSDRDKPKRDRLLELLGKQNVFVLGGHIHKYNLLVRATPGGGKFLQLGVSSVISAPEPLPSHQLSGVKDYTGDQVTVEPGFSPATEQQRRAVYQAEAPLVTQFQYADLPGYAVVKVNGPRVTATVYSGVGRQAWRTLALSDLLAS
jgi:acyl-coenzyme A synthetase/AMP-(fatty) acid ligase